MLENHIYHLSSYQILESISEGSFGQIYKAIHKKTNQIYAIKVLSLHHLSKYHKLHQISIEKQLLSTLRHPGIITLHETIKDNQNIYFVLQYCLNGDLSRLCKSLINIEIAVVKHKIIRFYFSQMVEAVDYLHQAGIVHRDLKLENILLDGLCHIKIIDFGTAFAYLQTTISKIVSEIFLKSQLQQLQSIIGSPEYVAPEILLYKRYSPKSDVWALGVILYRLYHFDYPFAGQTLAEIFLKIKHMHFHLDETICQEAKQLLLLCLNKDVELRPTIRQIKQHRYFSEVNFENVFKCLAPQVFDILQTPAQKKTQLGKYNKMILSLRLSKQQFILSFRLPLTNKQAGRLVLQSKTFAERTKVLKQFRIRSKFGRSLYFKLEKQQECDQWIDKINLITKHSV